MFGLNINGWAVLIAAVASCVFGFLWYSPFMFGKMWMRLTGAKNMGSKLAPLWSFIFALITSFVLANVIRYVNSKGVFGGITAGFWIWLGFIATTTISPVIYERKPIQLYLLNNGYNLLNLLLMGIIIAVW